MATPRAFTQQEYELIKSTTRYNPEDGTFERLYLRSNQWQKLKSKPRNDGYICIGYIFDNKYKWFMSHRVAYLLMTGELDFIGIDHINGNGADNRWSNLRTATPAQNMGNRREIGVCWRNEIKAWRVRLSINGKRKHFGYYKDKEEAIAAYRKAHAEQHKEFSPWFKDYGRLDEVEEALAD